MHSHQQHQQLFQQQVRHQRFLEQHQHQQLEEQTLHFNQQFEFHSRQHLRWFEKIASDKDGTITTDEMATYVVDSYGEFYTNYSGTTQSAVHTDKLDDLTIAFKDFNDSLSLMDSGEKTEFKAKVKDVQTFGAYN